MLRTAATILRMIRFSHTVFALPFALMALFLAGNAGRGGFPGWGKLALILVCMVSARSAAMTFNRIVDAKLDARNPRTAGRAIPAGQLGVGRARVFLYICALVFAAATYLFWRPLGTWFGYGNYWPMVLAAPVLLFICVYSYTKRFTWAAHFWLGVSLMLAPVGTWIAVAPPQGPVLSAAALVLGGAVLLWTAGFDIIYAFQDLAVDRRERLYSLPARLGTDNALWISRLCHSFAIMLLLGMIPLTRLGRIYLAAVMAAAVLLLVEHLLIWRGHLGLIHRAFGPINGLVSILVATAAMVELGGL